MFVVTNILKQWINTNLKPHHKLLVAFSGGRDSHVLLDSLVKLKSEYLFSLEAVHVNHGLQAISEQWVTHCTDVCEAYAIPLHTINLSLQILPGMSLEEEARVHRYEAMKHHVDENTMLLTAHTIDDQAETFLLQLIRGSGIKGLASIAPNKAFGRGTLARPLLSISRDEIAAYAIKQQLEWIEDPSNQNMQLRRNFMRSEIIKPLEQLHPNSSRCIARSAKHCQDTLALLDDYLTQDLANCLGDKPLTLKVEKIKSLVEQKQAWVLRHWLSHHQVTLPSVRKCQELLRQMLEAKGDRQPQVTWGMWQLRRYKQLIYLLPIDKPFDVSVRHDWHLESPIQLANGQRWQALPTLGKGLALAKLTQGTIRVAFRQGGERCNLANQQNSKSLKKVLQALDIPPWEREQTPLFYHGETLIGVGSLFICHDWQVQTTEDEGILFEMTKS